MTPKKLAQLIAGFASDKKAENIVVLDMRKQVNFCDYFVICSGHSTRQVQGIAAGVEEGLHQKGVDIRFKEGTKSSLWTLLDLGDVVVHVFEKDAREFYGLEHLWQDAVKVVWQQGT